MQRVALVIALIAGVTLSAQPPSASTSPIEDREWTLVQIGAQPLPALARVPTLTLASPSQRASGFTGCNRYTGSYQITGQQLTIEKVAATRMACLESGQVETAFIEALDRTRGWQVKGGALELLDADNRPLARFETTSRR